MAAPAMLGSAEARASGIIQALHEQGQRRARTEEDHARVLVGIPQVVARHGGPDKHGGHKERHHCHLH